MKALALLLVLGLAAPAHAQFIGPNGGVDASPFGQPPDFLWFAPAAGDYATLTAATGQTITCTRASTATYLDNAGTRQTAASNRCVVESVNTATGTPAASGTPMLRAEPNVTNQLLNSTAPATQTTASLATGVYTGWMEGSGSLAFTVGTATATGLPCTATSGKANDCHFTITAAGTITATVTGSVTAEQIEKEYFRTSLIVTAGTVVTRASDANSTPNAWNLVGPAYSEAAVAQFQGQDLVTINEYVFSTDVNYAARMFVSSTTQMLGRDDVPATSILVNCNTVCQTSLTRYSLSRSGATATASAAGVLGSPTALGSQPANPTTIFLGTLTGGFAASGIWISSMCISLSSAGCPP